MLLVARRAIARAHDARIELSAMTVVVAHLDGADEAAERTGILRPIEPRLITRDRPVGRRIAKQLAIVEARRVDDPVRVEHVGWIEGVLDGLKGPHDARAEHRFVELASRNAVAVLAAMRALVLTNEREAFLGDR